MDPQILEAQTNFISIHNQYNALHLRGKEMQKKMLSILQSTPYNSVIKYANLREENFDHLVFNMFGQQFFIYAETAFDASGRLTDGFLNTYFTDKQIATYSDHPTKIYSVSFDKIGNIDNRFTIDDFAVPYIMNVVSAYIKNVSDYHTSIKYTIVLREI